MGSGTRAFGLSAPLALLLSSALARPSLAAPAGPGVALPDPTTTYTIEALTSSGLGAMPMNGASLIRMAMGAQPSFETTRRELELRLQAPRTVSSPAAEHRIPAALAMGTALPLISSSTRPGERPSGKEEDSPNATGRLLIYRGCAESASTDQPEIITLQAMAPEQRRLAMQGIRQLDAGASSHGDPGTTGSWPWGDERPVVPLQGSLVGAHRVVSNYAPEISFQIGSGHDFLAPVNLSSEAAGQAQRLTWQAIPTALGYQATATGMGRQQGDVVLWTSSEATWGESSVPADLKAAEATRLVQRRVLLPPERTTCTVSAQAMAAMQTAMVTVTAFGDTLRLSSPAGEPAWQLRLERRSTATRPLGAGMAGPDPGSDDGKQAAPKTIRGFNPLNLF